MEQNVLIKRNDVCRRCFGEGVIKVQGFDHGHGHTQEPKFEKCSLCKGSGLVVVEKKIEITISPKVMTHGVHKKSAE